MKSKYLLAASFLILGLNIYLGRAFFLNPININYLENFYYESQWHTSFSKRTMADNELYQVAGYKILKGEPLFAINPETPPLGKYVYGTSITLLNNPYLGSLAIFILSMFAFWRLSLLVLENWVQASYALMLFSLSPLIASQLSQTMLDMPQLLFLLAHYYFFLRWLKHKDHAFKYLFLSGITLGVFSAAKIAILYPVIVGVGLLMAYGLSRKHFLHALLVVPLSLIAYASSYAQFFFSGGSLVEWYASQKWMLNFYLDSEGSNAIGMILVAAISGYFKGWWGEGWQRIREWSILWPLSLATAGYYLPTVTKGIKHRPQKINPSNQYLLIQMIGILAVFIFIPFWPRYFLLILPLGIIYLVKLISNFNQSYRLALLAVLVLQFIAYLNPRPDIMMNSAASSFLIGNYQELYNHTVEAHVSRQKFAAALDAVDAGTVASSRSAEFSCSRKWLLADTAECSLSLGYYTNNGLRENTMPVTVKKVENQWKLPWDWQYVSTDIYSYDTLERKILND